MTQPMSPEDAARLRLLGTGAAGNAAQSLVDRPGRLEQLEMEANGAPPPPPQPALPPPTPDPRVQRSLAKKLRDLFSR